MIAHISVIGRATPNVMYIVLLDLIASLVGPFWSGDVEDIVEAGNDRTLVVQSRLHQL